MKHIILYNTLSIPLIHFDYFFIDNYLPESKHSLLFRDHLY